MKTILFYRKAIKILKAKNNDLGLFCEYVFNLRKNQSYYEIDLKKIDFYNKSNVLNIRELKDNILTFNLGTIEYENTSQEEVKVTMKNIENLYIFLESLI